MNKKIAIIGASGIVGREIIKILVANNVAKDNILPFATSKKDVGHGITASPLDVSMAMKSDYVIMCASDDLSIEYAKHFAASGIKVIDTTSVYRNDHNIPLVIPEINYHNINDSNNLIANPNCVMIATLTGIYPIIKKFGISALNISSYQSTSGAGLHGMQALVNQTKTAFSGIEMQAEFFPREIIFNALPCIGNINNETGFSGEEEKIAMEVRKVLNQSDIDVYATCVRIPTLIGHGVSIDLHTKEDLPPLEDIINEYKDSNCAIYLDDPFYATCLDIIRESKTLVSRGRIIESQRILLWAMSNNITKGAGLNALQIIYKMENTPLIAH